MERRALLKYAGAGGIALAAAPVVRMLERSARAATPSRPRFYLHIVPLGGMDAVYTTDPKTTKEVEPGIDVPYPAKEIVETKGIRLGPSFRDLAKWIPRLAIVNMFRQNSANHYAGLAHALRCQGHATWSMPSLTDILGSRRNGEAVGSICMGAAFPSAYSPKHLGQPGHFLYGSQPGLFEHLDKAAPDDLRTASRAYRNEADALGTRRLTDLERGTLDNLLESSALFERFASAPRFSPVDWSPEKLATFPYDKDCQRALWLFENNVARCVSLCVGDMAFDTHAKAERQRELTASLATLLDRLFTELDARKVDGRPLSEQTAVIIGSEIGRFPRLNAAHGKDHFPQAPYLLFGPWFRTGAVYGATDRECVSRAVSLKTGQPDSAGRQLQLDDLGTSILRIDGANPEVYGYAGEHLEFLEA